jgi:hypothetical protein
VFDSRTPRVILEEIFFTLKRPFSAKKLKKENLSSILKTIKKIKH